MMRSILLSLGVVAALSPSAGADARAPRPKAPTAIRVTVDYQRVGRDLLELRDQRGKFDCGDLIPKFRAIKLDEAVATPASRIATAQTLAEIATKIVRLRGIHVNQDCLHNPLADGCNATAVR